jgi:hypothetical protein
MSKIIKKLSFQKILLIFAILVFIVGIITGEINFDFKKENNSQIEITDSLQKIENIT